MFVLGPLLNHNVAAMSGSVVAWTPSSASAKVWYDVSDISTLFQDTAGSTPVTADGQACKRVNDKSGNAINITAQNGVGWVYHTGAGKPYLAMPGGTTEYFAPAASQTYSDGSGQITMGAALNFTNNTGTQSVISGQDTFGNFLVNASGTAQAQAYTGAGANDGINSGPSITAATGIALTGIITTTTVEAYLNGTGVSPTTLGSSPGVVTDKLHIGFGCTGNFAGLALFPSALGSTDHASFVTWLQALV